MRPLLRKLEAYVWFSTENGGQFDTLVANEKLDDLEALVVSGGDESWMEIPTDWYWLGGVHGGCKYV